MNSLLKLTYRELEVFALLIQYELDVKHQIRKPMNMIDLRKYVMNVTKINKNNLSKYLNRFINNQLVIKHEDGVLELNNILLPIRDNNKVEIEFILNIE